MLTIGAPVGFIFTKSAITELIPIAKADDPAVDVIFVHGLDGDPFETWALRDEENWQTWITRAVPRANVWTLGYRLRSSKWFGGSMPMTDRAVNVLATLDVELVNDLPIVFVCHSYGGLLVKQLLRSGSEIATEYEALVGRVMGIVFLGTPNSGSSVANYAKALSLILRTSSAVDEIKRSPSYLQELTYWFRKRAKHSDWLLRAYFETLPTFGLIVVDQASADIGIETVTPTGVDANHVQICKPSMADFRVKQTVAMIEQVAHRARPRNSQSWMRKILIAPNDQLPFLRAQIEFELSADARNRELHLAIAYLDGLLVRAAPPPNATEVFKPIPSRRMIGVLGGALATVAILFVSGLAVMNNYTPVAVTGNLPVELVPPGNALHYPDLGDSERVLRFVYHGNKECDADIQKRLCVPKEDGRPTIVLRDATFDGKPLFAASNFLQPQFAGKLEFWRDTEDDVSFLKKASICARVTIDKSLCKGDVELEGVLAILGR